MDSVNSNTLVEQENSYEGLSIEQQQEVDKIVEEINIEDSQAVLQFGVSAQSKISNFADNILDQVRAKDSGHVGEILTELMVNIKGLDVEGLNKKGGLFGLFGVFKKSVQKFVAQYEKLSVHMDQTVQELDKSKMQLLKDITVLDNLYQKNLEYHHELEFYIIAGEKKIKQLKEVTLAQMISNAKQSNDPIDAQKVNDYNQMINRFEKKVHDLKLSRMVALQTGPQIRLVQSADQVLVEKIQSSILNTIPLWKNQIVIAISLFRQEKALKQQQEISNTTNELLLKNSEMLKQNTIEVAKESERGIVDVETLKKVNDDLIATIEETINIQKQGSQKRLQAEQELHAMEQQLKNKLIEIRQ